MGNRIFLLFFAVAALSVVFGTAASVLLALRRKSRKPVPIYVWLPLFLLAVLPLFCPLKPVRLLFFTDHTGGMRTEVRVLSGEEEPSDASYYLTRSGRRSAEGAALLFLTLWTVAGGASLSYGLSHYWNTVVFLTRNSTECRDARANEIFAAAKRKAGVRRSVTLRVMHPDLTVSPCMCGAVSPAVFVGENILSDYSDEWLEMVFLHELTHIRHRDGLLRVCALAAVSFHALLPVSEKVRAAVGEDMEYLCDRGVLRAIGPEKAGDYFRMIVDVAERNLDGNALGGGLLAPVSEAGDMIVRRYKRIKRGEEKRGSKYWIAPAAALLLNLVLLNAVGAENPDNLRLDFENPFLSAALAEHFALDDPRMLTEEDLAGVWSMEFFASDGIPGCWYCIVNEERPEGSETGEGYPIDRDSVCLDDLPLFPHLRTLILEGNLWKIPEGSEPVSDCAVIFRSPWKKDG